MHDTPHVNVRTLLVGNEMCQFLSYEYSIAGHLLVGGSAEFTYLCLWVFWFCLLNVIPKNYDAFRCYVMYYSKCWTYLLQIKFVAKLGKFDGLN